MIREEVIKLINERDAQASPHPEWKVPKLLVVLSEEKYSEVIKQSQGETREEKGLYLSQSAHLEKPPEELPVHREEAALCT
ncbi:MAG TPA: hypothetical protein VK536_06565 [Candidatus Limnocylindrales bacterium]|nr:hypothetical protein [Candidatus Limnocylindrales bacterium]